MRKTLLNDLNLMNLRRFTIDVQTPAVKPRIGTVGTGLDHHLTPILASAKCLITIRGHHRPNVLSSCSFKRHGHGWLAVVGKISRSFQARNDRRARLYTSSLAATFTAVRRAVQWRGGGTCSRVRLRFATGSKTAEVAALRQSTMVLQVLDQVGTGEEESFYGDCPTSLANAISSYTNLDVNTTGQPTCTVISPG